mgnify:CR=1 FL=1
MNNPPAFPNVAVKDPFDRSGMTLRDYFAAKVIQGIVTRGVVYPSELDTYAKNAYAMADAMLEARK